MVLLMPSIIKDKTKMKKLIIAHRGASSLAPENTLAAFQKAMDCGADMTELDVRRSKDKQLMVIHDKKLAAKNAERKNPEFLNFFCQRRKNL